MPASDEKFGQDAWGYFNRNAASLIPTIYVYDTQPHAERYRLQPIPGQTPTRILSGADRSTSPTDVMTGALEKIVYPSGGW